MPPDTSLVDSDSFYRTLVENASEGMLTIDTESRIVYANPAIEDILGYEPAELVGSSKMTIIPERLQSTHAEALESYVETGTRHIDWDGIELPARHKDGHEVPTLISLREHEFDGDQYFTGIVRDISERQEREEALRDQKERLDQFADILAHDIRNPLTVAQGYVELAREDDDTPELERVGDALDRIDHLVDDVLALSKAGRIVGRSESVDLPALVEDAWETTETRDATLHVEDGLGAITADRSRVSELFENLFRNAVEHGGDAVDVRVGPLGTGTGFYVADDGPGIDESIRESVVDHGFSTDVDGTGYGLSIVQQIAAGHGWELTITDGPEGGARFDFRGVDQD